MVDTIKSQELAVSKVKTKLDELVSGTKEPECIKSLEKGFKKAEEEITDLEKQYNQVIDQIIQKQFDLYYAPGLGKTDEEVATIETEQGNLENKKSELATQLENTKKRAQQLKKELEQLKLNPDNSAEVHQLAQQLEVMNSKLSQTKEEANQAKNEITEAFKKNYLIKFGDGFNEIGKKIDKFKSKMTKLIGTAMIFNLLRNSLTNLRNGFINLLKTNNNFSSSLNQIKANLMTAFAPIYNACLPAINSLMMTLSKLTGTIAMFVSGLFGKSIEETEKDAKKLSKQLKDVNKNGSKASDSLASFDRLEVVSDNSGAGGSSGVNYNGELVYNQKLLEFLNKIKDVLIHNKGLLIEIAKWVGLAFAVSKIIAFGSSFTPLISVLGTVFKFIANNAATIGGIASLIGGLIIFIKAIIDYLNDPTWENFKQILSGLAIIAAGIFLLFGGIPTLIVAIIGAIVALGLAIYKNWDKIKDFLGKVGQWFYDNVIKPVADFFVELWNGLVDGASNAWNGIKKIFSAVATFFKNIFSNAWNAVKKVFSTGGKIFTGIKDGILNGFTAIVNAIIRGINKVVSIPFNGINWALRKIRDISFLGVSPFKGIIKEISVPKIPELATGAVIPPRHKFAAILGDQKHGTNIEAPLETIKQANREVMQEFLGKLSGLNNSERDIILKNLTFVLQCGTSSFQKLVIDSLRISEKELGKQLLVS